MQYVGIAIMLVGAVLSLYGGIRILIAAFQKSVLWGLGCLFIPFVILIFVIQNWAETKTPFLINIAGAVLTVVGSALSAMG